MKIDFEGIINKNLSEDGKVDAAKLASAISSAVGREFVEKDRYNAKLDEIETLKNEKQTAEDNATTAGKWEAKYTKLKTEFDEYKADTEAKAKLSEIKGAYRKLLEESGIDAKRLDTIIRATVFDGMKLDTEGKLENADALKKTIEKEWADFKVTTQTKGADVANPPTNPSGDGANPRAAEIAKRFHERRYGKVPDDGATTTNNG